MMDWSTLVGIPWRDHGRDAQGCDCWGLLRLALRLGRGIELPAYDNSYRSAADRDEIAAIAAGALGDWLPVAEGDARPFDGVLMTVAGRLHVGVVVRRGLMLHMTARQASVIEPYSRYAVEGIYRHRSLA